MRKTITLEPIGIIHSPFSSLTEIPFQPRFARGVQGSVELNEEYEVGLKDLEGFSHIILLSYLHEVHDFDLKVTPSMDTRMRGLFATRAPRRPNPIGISVVRLQSVEDNILIIRNIDMLDGTPVLDIKPYIREFDDFAAVKSGWFEEVLHEKQQRSEPRPMGNYREARESMKKRT